MHGQTRTIIFLTQQEQVKFSSSSMSPHRLASLQRLLEESH